MQRPEDISDILFKKYVSYMQNHVNFRKKISGREGSLSSVIPEQRRVCDLLDGKNPTSFNELLEKSGYNFVKLQYILLEMEISGLIYQQDRILISGIYEEMLME